MRRAKRMGVGIVFGCVAIGGWAWAEIDGSKHDFSNQEWTNGDVCSACHGPERSEPPAAAPLWDAEADLNRVFGTPLGTDNDPGNGTLACLRCHDGTIAKETVSQQSKDRFSHKQNAALFQGGHQRSDHPVGVEYPQFDEGFRPIISVISLGKIPLPDGKVECVSCHDPHAAADVEHMLVMKDYRSALCLSCHKK